MPTTLGFGRPGRKPETLNPPTVKFPPTGTVRKRDRSREAAFAGSRAV